MEKNEKTNKPKAPVLTPNRRAKCISLFRLSHHHLRTGMTIRPHTAQCQSMLCSINACIIFFKQ